MDSDDEMFYEDIDEEASGNNKESSDSDSEYFAIDVGCTSDDLQELRADKIEEEEEEEEDYPFEILSTEQIVQYMVDFIKDVNGVVEIPATITRILLNHFNWDKQKLMEKYYDGDREKLFAEARIAACSLHHLQARCDENSGGNTPDEEEEDCGVCFATRSSSTMAGLPGCGHRFCLDCWNDYLTTKITEDGLSGETIIACAGHECDQLVDDATVTRLLRDPKVKLKYQQLITNRFVECNLLLRWCPTPGCALAIKVQHRDAKPVTCSGCAGTVCFACAEAWHEPIDCRLLRKWLRQCERDSANAKWISGNTKECPKCHASIEKNGGCNYIRCQKCAHQFCWICMNAWSIHPSSWYRCNKYSQDKSQDPHDPHDPTKSLQRYLFYHFRYVTHGDSLKLEGQLYAKVAERMDDMQRHQDMSWIEVQFLRRAVDVLRSCRRSLMYTYAFAFYLRKTNQTAIFEDNQRDLELAIETLSGYLERDVDESHHAVAVAVVKQTVVDKSTYCEARRKALLRHVREGYERDWWEYED